MSEKIVQLNEEIIKGQIKELVRGSVEETLIEMYLAGIPGRQIPALHGAFLPQCFLCCGQIQGQNCGKNAQGDPRPGEQESVPREGEGRGRRVARHEAEGGRQEGRGRH